MMPGPFMTKGASFTPFTASAAIWSRSASFSPIHTSCSSRCCCARPQNRRARFVLKDIVAESDAMTKNIEMAEKVAGGNSSVMIIGETGTGKELFAAGIHNVSHYANGPFIPINCSAIPETLLESLLFGSTKGAFTGAVDSPGLFEQARGGTVFLDEINSMPYKLQGKLLRVLQDKMVRRVGSQVDTPLDCRIISASNIDPFTGSHDGDIRDDLLFRLSPSSSTFRRCGSGRTSCR